METTNKVTGAVLQPNLEIIGYLVGGDPLVKRPQGTLVTRAFIICCECNKPISSVGGPIYNAVCLDCVKKEC